MDENDNTYDFYYSIGRNHTSWHFAIFELHSGADRLQRLFKQINSHNFLAID